MNEREASRIVRRTARDWLRENHDIVMSKDMIALSDHADFRAFLLAEVPFIQTYETPDRGVHDFRQWLNSEFRTYKAANE